MKLLIFIYSMGGGGAERATANLANYWAEKGWDITVLTLVPGDSDFYILHPSVKRTSLMLAKDSNNILVGLWQNFHRIAALRRVLRQVRPDIALGMMSTANVLLALAAWGLPGLRTIGAEQIHPPQMPLGLFWENLRSHTYGLLNVVTALTGKSENWIKEHTNAKKVVVIPNSIAWPLIGKGPVIHPRDLCQPGRKILLAVGRLDAQKGFDWLIEAFYNLSSKHPDWNLVILGEGHLRKTLETQVQQSGLEKYIFLPGWVGNLSEWYGSADLYVMSSRFEGFGNTLVEAMAHGLSAVSFDCDTGPGDIIRHEVDGLLVPPGDLASLTAALDRLISDRLERQHFAQKALEARMRFSMEKITGMWEELFETILSE